MIYLFLGEDQGAKERKIAEIKAQYQISGDALNLDYELLYSTKLGPADLKKALLALPAIANKRLVLIRSVEKLNTQNKDIIIDFISEQYSHAVIILDTGDFAPKGGFYSKISASAKVMRFGKDVVKENVFDMTRAISAGDPSQALLILRRLIDEGDNPLRIMGGLVWYWGKAKNRLSADRFKKGLLVLQEADLNIKRSRLSPEHAVEIAVTKLSSPKLC